MRPLHPRARAPSPTCSAQPAPVSCTAANAASPSANRIRTVLALRFSVPYASEPLPSRHFFPRKSALALVTPSGSDDRSFAWAAQGCGLGPARGVVGREAKPGSHRGRAGRWHWRRVRLKSPRLTLGKKKAVNAHFVNSPPERPAYPLSSYSTLSLPLQIGRSRVESRSVL